MPATTDNTQIVVEEQAVSTPEVPTVVENPLYTEPEITLAETAVDITIPADTQETVDLTAQVPEPTIAPVTNFTAWNGPVLNRRSGTVTGPSGKETYYNLDMSGIVNSIKNHTWIWKDASPENQQNLLGDYWVRDDGVKMLGQYIMCAANLAVHPRGSLVPTSLGTAVVVDTGDFAAYNSQQLDIAVTW